MIRSHGGAARRLWAAQALILGLGCCGPLTGEGDATAAETKRATPETIDSVLASAAPGDKIILTGRFDAIEFRKRVFDPPITIDASAATVRGITMVNSQGITWTGGGVTGRTDDDTDWTKRYGILIKSSSGFRLKNVEVSGWGRGMVIDKSTDVEVRDSHFTNLRSDGVDIALSQRVTVNGNKFDEFKPVPRVNDPVTGKMIRDGDHPDAVQIWSRPGNIVADVMIANNIATGSMQCFSGFNHVRNGVNDGGYDRITITGNTCKNPGWVGTSLNDCRSCTITNNTYASFPGSKHKTHVNFGTLTGMVCGNRVADMPTEASTVPCGSKKE